MKVKYNHVKEKRKQDDPMLQSGGPDAASL